MPAVLDALHRDRLLRSAQSTSRSGSTGRPDAACDGRIKGAIAARNGISIYQDIVLAGQVARRGVRDNDARWRLIEPWLPRGGTVLDVGSNFGWFGLQICATRPDCLVASIEADPRSAAVQQCVLQSNEADRVVLLTARAGAAMARSFARHRQRFDAVLCLNILHWLSDHRDFLRALDPLSGALLIEHPHPDEANVGIDHVRREIGPIDEYLATTLPGRPIECLGWVPGLRDGLQRAMWRVGPRPGQANDSTASLDVAALVEHDIAWPLRAFWREAIAQAGEKDGRWLLTPRGLECDPTHGAATVGPTSRRAVQRLFTRIPRQRLFTPRTWCRRQLRRAAGSLLRACRLR